MEKGKKHKSKIDPEVRKTIRRWEKLREEISKAWDNKLTALEEIRAQRGK